MAKNFNLIMSSPGNHHNRQPPNANNFNYGQPTDLVSQMLSKASSKDNGKHHQQQRQHQQSWQAALAEAKAASHRFVENSYKQEIPKKSAQRIKMGATSRSSGYHRMSAQHPSSDTIGRFDTQNHNSHWEPPVTLYRERANPNKGPRVEINLASSSSEDEKEPKTQPKPPPNRNDSLLGRLPTTTAPSKLRVPERTPSTPPMESQKKPETTDTKPFPPWLPPTSVMRLQYSCRTLEQLEQATLRWFCSQHKRQRQGTSSTAQPEPRLLPLRFNDVSVSTVALWCANFQQRRQQHSKKGPQNTMYHRPTVDTRYRECSVCGLFGHYEMECPSLTEADQVRFASALVELNEKQRPPPLAFGMDDDTLYDVVVEVCDGFAIEQRVGPEPASPGQSFGETSITNGKDTATDENVKQHRGDEEIEIDGFTIHLAKSSGAFGKQAQGVDSKSATQRRIPLKKGMIVLWYPLEEQQTITVGQVQQINAAETKVLVKVMHTIAPTQEASDSELAGVQKQPVELWKSPNELYINCEKGGNPARPLRKRGTATHTSSKPRSKRARLQHRYRMINRINEDDMSIRPARRPRQRPDGSWVAPAGRKPNGREWDSSRGLWVLSDNKHENNEHLA